MSAAKSAADYAQDHTDTDFWTWSLKAYEQKGAAPSLLRLQDEAGLNVNLVLWCLWCAQKYREPEEALLRKAIDLTSHWSAPIAASLRTARKALKSPPPQADAANAKALRDTIKRAELDAEKLEQDILHALAHTHLGASDNEIPETPATTLNPKKHSSARRALASYAALMGATHAKGFSVSLLEEAITAIFGTEEQQDASKT